MCFGSLGRPRHLKTIIQKAQWGQLRVFLAFLIKSEFVSVLYFSMDLIAIGTGDYVLWVFCTF